MSLWVVVLAGGVGSRFWPLSTPPRPKQLLPLVGEQPLLVETLQRLAPLVPAARTLVLTNAELADAVRAVAPTVPAANVLAEPRPAGTAAALAWAAAAIARRGGANDVMLCVHADWAIGDDEGFRAALASAATAAERHRRLVTVGIVPDRPEIGYGYIEPGVALDDGVRAVARFVEKPNRERAADMCAAGCLWNSGIFAWRVDDFLAEIERHTPEVWPALRAAADDAESFFAAVTPVSVDVGVLERSDAVLVVPGDFGWDDVGTWAALARVGTRDAAGNVARGSVLSVEAGANVAHADGTTIVLYGVDGLVVVARAGVTLVTTVERATALKVLLDGLPAELRDLR